MATLDVSVADISDSVVEILSTNGDVYCGGSDIDKAIADHIVDVFNKENGIDLSKDVMAYARVYEAAEKAKCELSSTTSTDVNLPYVSVKDGTPIHLNITLTRAKFEQLAKPTISKVIACGKKALQDANLTSKELDGILLVGGSCRIPLVQEMLEIEFGVKLIKDVNLDEAVAMGAAIQGSIINGDSNSDLLLLDVTPLSVGIETMGGVMTKLVEANTTIPCKRTQIFSTAVDNQSAVTIRCLQGERPMANDNKEIGVFNLEGITPAKRGVPQIEVTFDIDVNGIMKVSAIDKATGKEQNITIESNSSLTPEEIERVKSEAEAHKAEDEKKRVELEKLNKVSSLLYTTETTIDNYKDKPELLTEEVKKYFDERVEKLKEMEKNKDFSNLETLEQEITSKWNEIATKAYAANNPSGGNPMGGFDMNDFMKNAGMGGFDMGSSDNNSQPQTENDGFEDVK